MGTKKSGLAGALFSKTQQRVLGLLFGQPNRSFFATEIFNLVDLGRGAVQRELGRLEESGIVIVTHIGNQKHYQANRAAPLFHELHSIMLKTSALAEPLRKALRPLEKKIQLALVYGSVARGDDRAGSDVDLLVVADDLMLEDLFRRLDPTERFLGRKINPTLYTSAEFQRRRRSKQPFLEKVLRGETIELIGKPDDANLIR